MRGGSAVVSTPVLWWWRVAVRGRKRTHRLCALLCVMQDDIGESLAAAGMACDAVIAQLTQMMKCVGIGVRGRRIGHVGLAPG